MIHTVVNYYYQIVLSCCCNKQTHSNDSQSHGSELYYQIVLS